MTYTLGGLANSRTVFMARFSELTDRFDPEMVLFRRKEHDFKYEPRKLRSYFSEPPQYGAGEPGIERTSESQPRYVRITDIDEHGILNNELGATAEKVEPRYLLREGDLLVARSGNTVGKSYLHKAAHAPSSCFFAGYLIRLRFKTAGVMPDYVFAFTQLPYYKQWVAATQRAAGQPNINAKEYSSLVVPAAPLEIQQKVVMLLEAAYVAKRAREIEAQSLLLSIDDVLFDELCIPRIPEPPNTIEGRIFRRSLSELSGSRLDPIANQDKRKHLEKAIHSSSYSVQHLREIVEAAKTQVSEIKDGENYVGLENIVGESGEFIATSDKETIGTANRFFPGQVLFPKLRPYLNKTHLTTFEGVCSTEFHVFVPHGVSAEYLTAFLRSRAIVGITSLLMTGNTLPRLQMSDIERLPVVVPPPHIQEIVCGKIDKLRNEARELKLGAAAELEKAKQEIEALILGKVGVE